MGPERDNRGVREGVIMTLPQQIKGYLVGALRAAAVGEIAMRKFG